MIDLLDEHRRYLADGVRIDAYARALATVVRPGSVVLDLGAGTGILGLLACRAGAARVYAVDEGPVLELAREIAAANGYADRIVHLAGHSAWTPLPEPVDVVVADQVGNFGFEAGIFDDVPAAAARVLRPGGHVVPRHVSLHVAPVALPAARARVDAWRESVAGFDVSVVTRMARVTGWPQTVTPADGLGPGTRLIGVDLLPPPPPVLTAEVHTTCAREGRLDGLVGWFEAELATGVTMSNSPFGPSPIDRRPLYLPVDPIAVAPGDTVGMRLHLSPATGAARWRVEVTSTDGRARGASDHHSIDGLLLSADDLRRSAPRYRPSLTRAGEAHLEVLRRCDGGHALADIERELSARFPDVWPTPAAAGPFVIGIVRRHGR